MQKGSVWNWEVDDGRTGSDPGMPERHGDVIHKVVNMLGGPGWLCVPRARNRTNYANYGEYECSNCDGRTMYVILWRN